MQAIVTDDPRQIFSKVPFMQALGMQRDFSEGGKARLSLDPKPEHGNVIGGVHGGIVVTMLDVVMATAARSVEPQLGVVTIEMKTSFMRPAKVPAGVALVARGLLQHRTRSMAFTEGRVYDAEGQLCAVATGTFKYVVRRESANPSTD